MFTSCFWDGRRRTVDGYEWSHLHDCPSSAAVLAILKQRHWAMTYPVTPSAANTTLFLVVATGNLA